MFKLLYTTPAVEDALCDGAFAAACVTVMRALVRVQEDLGLIPRGEARKLDSPPAFDLAAAQRTGLRGNPVAGLVEQAYAVTPYALYGIASTDLWDMAHVLQLRAAVSHIFDDARTLVAALADLAETHAETPMLARTHGRAGPPTTFGFKVAVWLDELLRDAERVHNALHAASIVSLAGSAGTASSFAVLGAEPADVERRLAAALELEAPSTPWVTARDRSAALAAALNSLASLLGKIGHEICTLERTGIGELDERGGFGSMATPHKESNPWTAARMHGLGAIARGLTVVVANGAALPEGEREIGTSYAEWYGLAQLCGIAARACADAVDLFGRLTVDVQAIRTNLERDPAVRSESLSMLLAKHVGKQRAHELMHDAIRRFRAGEPFERSVEAAFRDAGIAAPDLDSPISGELGYAVSRTLDVVARARAWLAG